VGNNIFLSVANLVKPFLVRKYVIGCSSVLLKLRNKCNGVTNSILKFFSACLLVGTFVKPKMSRGFSFLKEIDSERSFKRSILEDLLNRRWPTDCINKRKFINNYVKNIQNQILLCKRDNQLNFITYHVFNIKNRIFSIDKILKDSKSSSYFQAGYSDLLIKSHKFDLLEQTKLSNLSKLPPCKAVIVEFPKTNGGTRPLDMGVSMPIDRVLQRMFLNFLDVIVEQELKPNVFAYRKGRDPRMAVASVYSKLNRTKYLDQMCLGSVNLVNCFANLSHNQIINQYPFPDSYNFLLSRWLAPNLIDKNCDFKNLGKLSRGVSQNSIIGPSIANLLLSNAFPLDILKEEGKLRRKMWFDIYSYANNIILISNNRALFFSQLTKLKKNLKKIGLSLNNKNLKTFICIKSKIKFQFLDFEFIVMPRAKLKRSPLLSNFKNLHSLQKATKGFGIILRPNPAKVKSIKALLKAIIKRILHQPRKHIYKSFLQINAALLGWGAYFCFGQGCVYAKRVDHFVFRFLKKILVKKFRYNGLLRPKWVAYNFLGLEKANPNGNKWQPRALQYVKNTSKISKYVYIWYCNDTFSRLCVTSFLLNFNIRKMNYYAFPSRFKKNIAKLITRRLLPDLKVKLFNEQEGFCLVCKEQMNEDLLISRSPKLHIHHLVPNSVAHKTKLNKKLYESRKNKVLLHESCHLILHKNDLFQDSYLLRTSVPSKPIIS